MDLQFPPTFSLVLNANTALVALNAPTVFDFTQGLPTDWSIDSSGNAATPNSSGQWVQNSTDGFRTYYTAAGVNQGVLIEPPRTNLVNHANMAPTTIGDIVATSGDGTATVVADATAVNATLEGRTFAALQNGNSIRLTGGTTGTTYRLSVDGGTVAEFSYRVAFAPQGSGYIGNFKTNDGKGIVNFNGNGGTWIEAKSEGFEPNHSTRHFVVYLGAGKEINILGSQYEQGEDCTSPIITTGTTGTSRVDDEVYIDTLDEQSWWSQDEGAIVSLVYRDALQGYDAGFVTAIDNAAGNTSQIGVRTATGGLARVDGQFLSGGQDDSVEFVGIQLTDDVFAVGIMWENVPGQPTKKKVTTFASNGFRFQRVEEADEVAGTIDALYLGRINRYYGYANQRVKKLLVFKGATTFADIDAVVNTEYDKFPAFNGQSNTEGLSEVEGVFTNGGEVTAIARLKELFPSGRHGISNMAIGGSALYARNNAVNYWLENDGVTPGPLLLRAVEAQAPLDPPFMYWNQGESDSGETEQSLVDGWTRVFEYWRANVAQVPIIMGYPARRGDSGSGNTFFRRWASAYDTIAAANNWAHVGPNAKDLHMLFDDGGSDDIHISDTGNQTLATRAINLGMSLAGTNVGVPVLGPTINTVTVVGMTVTIDLTLPSGITDISSGEADGFVFEDNGVEITWTTKPSRTTSTRLVGTLSSTPTGTQVLYHCYDSGFGIDPATLVKGNDVNSLPLQPARIYI